MIKINTIFSLATLLSQIKKIKFSEKTNFNNFFEDGLENNNLHEISGEGGSGKSNFCLMLMLQAALPIKLGGLDMNVLYISTVKQLSDKRLGQILETLPLSKSELNKINKNVHLENIEATQFESYLVEVEKFIEDNKIKMIIIDSIAGLSDVQFINENNEVDYIGRAQFLRRIIVRFKELIVKYNLFFFVTNNVKGDIDKGNGKSIPSLGLIWENGVNTRILLHKEEAVRKIEIVFSNYLDSKIAEFKITNAGLEIFSINY